MHFTFKPTPHQHPMSDNSIRNVSYAGEQLRLVLSVMRGAAKSRSILHGPLS